MAKGTSWNYGLNIQNRLNELKNKGYSNDEALTKIYSERNKPKPRTRQTRQTRPKKSNTLNFGIRIPRF